MRKLALPLFVVVLFACDDKKDVPPTTPSASATASATPIASATATTTAVASAAPSAAPSASAATSTKDPTLSVLDPATEPAKTMKAQAGGTATLYLPQWPGTTWTPKDPPKPLGKAKTETLPGFAGPTPGVSFAWTLKDPSLKAGQSFKVVIENKSSADKTAAPKTFTLTIEIVAS